jgi:hypothetical protein
MTTGTGGTVRKFFTRSVAASILLAMYCMGTIAVTGGLLTATTTSAEAYWRRGWRGRGWRGRGVWRRGRCHHRGWSSRRVCW